MSRKRIIRGIVCVILFSVIHTNVAAQDFKVNSQISSPNTYRTGYNSTPATSMSGSMGRNNYSSVGSIQSTSNMGCYKGITHTMPSMSQPSNCSTVLGFYDNDTQSDANNSGRPSGPRRVSEDDHNADPMLPIGDTPWVIMALLALGYIAFVTYRRHKTSRT